MLFDLAKKKNSEEPHAKCERPVIWVHNRVSTLIFLSNLFEDPIECLLFKNKIPIQQFKPQIYLTIKFSDTNFYNFFIWSGLCVHEVLGWTILKQCYSNNNLLA